MRPGTNPIEEYKQAEHGDPLQVQQDLSPTDHSGLAESECRRQRVAEVDWSVLAETHPRQIHDAHPDAERICPRAVNWRQSRICLHASATAHSTSPHGSRSSFADTASKVFPEIFERLRGVNLTTLQTGQDNVRNINGCALAGLNSNELFDASGIIFALDRTIVGDRWQSRVRRPAAENQYRCHGMRRENCTHSESQDIALVPATKFIHGTLYSGFHVLAGGKMGSGGFTIASNLGWFVEPDQAHDVVVQMVKLFRDEGGA